MAGLPHDVGRLVGRDLEIVRAVDALRAGLSLIVRVAPAAGATSFTHHVAERLASRPIHVRADTDSRSIPFAALAPITGSTTPGPHIETTVADVARRLCGSDCESRVVIVNDAHALDAGSAVALAQACDEGLRLILTVPTTAPLPPALSTLERDGRLTEIALGHISDAAVTRLAGEVLGGQVEPGIVRSLTRLVGAAPAAIVDVLSAARTSGAIRRDGQIWRLAGSLTITAPTVSRVSVFTEPIGTDGIEALDLIAVSGSLPIGMIEQLVGQEQLAAVEHLGLVVVDEGADGPSVRIADTVVRSVRRHLLPRSRRRALAHRLHTTLHAGPSVSEGGWAVDPVLDASLQFSAGRVPVDAFAAARSAQATGDIDLAEQLCRAIPQWRDDVDVVIVLAELLSALGRNREAEAELGRLIVERSDHVALVAMARAVNLGIHLDQVEEALEIIERAIDGLDDSPWVAELIGVRGVFHLMLGEPAEALAIVDPHLEEREGRQFVEAATAAAPAMVMMGRHLDAAELAGVALEERLRLGDQQMLQSPGLHALIRAMGLAEAGALAEADELTEFVLAGALQLGLPDGIMWAGVIRGRSLLDQGRYPEASDMFRLAATSAIDLNLIPHLRWARGGTVLAAAQLGDIDATRQALEGLDTCPPTRLDLMASEIERARAWAAVAERRLPTAVDRFVTAADLARAGHQPGLEVLPLHDLVRIGRTEHVARLVELGGLVQGALAAARVAHAVALAAADGDALLDVSERFESLGAIVVAAEAANQAAWEFQRQSRAPAAERTRKRVGQLRATRPGAATPALDGTPGMAWLTQREREVAAMAAKGFASKQIAGELGVSVRTVDNLLQRVYRKLGITGRQDLRSGPDPSAGS